MIIASSTLRANPLLIPKFDRTPPTSLATDFCVSSGDYKNTVCFDGGTGISTIGGTLKCTHIVNSPPIVVSLCDGNAHVMPTSQAYDIFASIDPYDAQYIATWTQTTTVNACVKTRDKTEFFTDQNPGSAFTCVKKADGSSIFVKSK